MSTNLLIAMVGALGVGLCVAGLLYPIWERVGREGKKAHAGLEGADRLAQADEVVDEIAALDEAPLLDRMIGPAVRDLVAFLGRDAEKRRQLTERLRRSGWRYKSVGDYHANKVLTAALFFVGGAVAVVMIGEPGLFFVPLLLGALGLFIPDREVAEALKRRRKALYVEMAFTLDQLALLVEAGLAFQQALAEQAKARGPGIFTEALRSAVTRVKLGVPVGKSLLEMLDDLPEEGELDKFVQRVLKGGPLADALRAQSDLMRNRVESELLAQGLRSTLIITTVGGAFILPALALLVVGPPIMMAMQIFRF
jgi:Flp pilus assembly protein TadB